MRMIYAIIKNGTSITHSQIIMVNSITEMNKTSHCYVMAFSSIIGLHTPVKNNYYSRLVKVKFKCHCPSISRVERAPCVTLRRHRILASIRYRYWSEDFRFIRDFSFFVLPVASKSVFHKASALCLLTLY